MKTYQCPNCEGTSIQVDAKVIVLLTCDNIGTRQEAFGEFEYDNNSWASCTDCDKTGTLADFSAKD